MSPSEPTSVTTTALPWPSAVASTPDDSISRYGRTTTAASSMTSAIWASARKRKRQSIRSETPSSRASSRYGSAGSIGSPATTRRTSGTCSAIAGSARIRRSSPFDRRMSPKKRSVDPCGGAISRNGVKTGCGMRTIFARSTPSAANCSTARGAVDDDAIDGREHASPKVELVGRPPRQHVVGREDDRPLPLRRLQPAEVVARQPQPLHVEHVGVETRDLLLEPPCARRVLEPLHEEAEA